MNSFELNLNNNLLVAPSKSVFNDIAYKRGLIHKNNEIYALEKYRAGMEGEAILRSYLREYEMKIGLFYGMCDWIIMELSSVI